MRKALSTPCTDTATDARSRALVRASVGFDTVAVNSIETLAVASTASSPIFRSMPAPETSTSAVRAGVAEPLERGAAAVCIPTYGAFDVFAQCLHSVLSHNDTAAPVIYALSRHDGVAAPRL